ncbi:glutathione S-transferase [Actibacterium mucosum KCTC 23349]|uniref:Glutathione S-transferase n=1 Tax=Actibacterium mucosum KCTC 23349 TaxID=1454373 RepID=A0A037ZN08_9RHOB|nr:glutathione S-transferase C-terminal domain-containing protein [Actibacterium mucosum]KAJ57459.1 glutathione S-transferase [Actibacterium mucosum KCTC 23349]
MGVMINGVYHADDPTPDSAADGEYRRAASNIRDRITVDGAEGYAPEPGRYHLYVAWNCPWAHRTLLARGILGLQDVISTSYAKPRRNEDGWIFDVDGPFADPELGVSAMHHVYARQTPPYTGRVTVPVLWDRQTQRIVSNESADIVRMLGQAFAPEAGLYPTDLANEIDRWNTRIYADVNNGVYRAGFARTQAAYDTAVITLFDALDVIEAQLSRTRYLTGDRFTEADLRLFPTLARFDVAYHTAFKCNRNRIADYTNLWAYARDIYQMPGVAGTVDFDIYRQGYFSPSPHRNPHGIVAIGPRFDWTASHGRG